ncbi:MAG: restriction endonuclease subunit S [Bacteroides sp.]
MEIKTLGELCNIVSGGTPSRSKAEFWNEGTIPWIKIGNIKGKYVNEADEFITQKGLAGSSAKMLAKGTVLYTIFATLGEVGILDIDACTNQAIAGLTIKNTNQLSIDYLYYYLRSKKAYVNNIGRGVAQNNINMSILKSFEVPLPELSRQTEIVEIISKVSKIIETRQQELECLDNLIKARFVEMFGDPDINPKGWTECALSEKLNVVGGYAFKSNMFDEDGGIPVLRIGNINAGYFKPVNLVYWQEDEDLERYAMYPGDLVMSLTGTVGKDDYGNVCILGDDYEMYYLNQRNAKLEIKEGIDKFYIAQLLKFEQIKKKLTGISRGVRQANISNKDILNLVVPVPPMELQNQFADFVNQVDKSKVVYMCIHKKLGKQKKQIKYKIA